MEIYIIVAVLFLLLFLRVPVSISLAIPALIGLYFQDLPFVSLVQRMYSGTESWVLMAIPFFILAGLLMESGGLSERMVAFADALLGFLPGGLANVNIAASMLFGGISGSAVADTSALGTVLIPQMIKRGYTKEYSAAITAASSPIGMIIPPSIPMILWSFVSSESLGNLFLGGVIPGILVGLGLMVVSTIICVRRGFQPHGSRFQLQALKNTAVDGCIALLAPIIIIGGITSGFFTATEAAMIAVAYSFIITFFYYRELDLKKLMPLLLRAGKTAASIMFIIGTATAFSWVLALYRVPQTLGAGILDASGGSPALFMLMTCTLVFILGMFLDIGVIILLVGPVIAPVMPLVGLDTLQTGLILMVVLATGVITPPLGLCLFVVTSILEVKLEKVAWECVPFVILMLVVAVLMWYIPGLSTWIPAFFA